MARIYTIVPPRTQSLNEVRPPYGSEAIRPLSPERRKIIFSKPPKAMGMDRPAQSKAGQP